jgi:hypothetical protein
MNFRKRALQYFLNDEPEELLPELYLWRGRHYQVIPYNHIKKLKYSPDSFIKVFSSGRWFGIRELSTNLLKKYYHGYYLLSLDK